MYTNVCMNLFEMPCLVSVIQKLFSGTWLIKGLPGTPVPDTCHYRIWSLDPHVDSTFAHRIDSDLV